MEPYGQRSGDSDSESDFDEEYFARTYRPLSNLPTPPASSLNTSRALSPRSTLEEGDLLESDLLGPAIHLTNLIPPTASLTAPSMVLVHELLTRADLPLETIALAVCILDSLDSKFSLSWRLVCPLASSPAGTATSSKRYTVPGVPPCPDQLNIDAVPPELIILASLVVAVKFLHDSERPTHFYTAHWGQNLWTCAQLNATERCIVEKLGYRILPLWQPELIDDALADMARAGRRAVAPSSQTARPFCCGVPPATWVPREHQEEDSHKRSLSDGRGAVGTAAGEIGSEWQFTPAESPVSEECGCVVGTAPTRYLMGSDTHAAFCASSRRFYE